MRVLRILEQAQNEVGEYHNVEASAFIAADDQLAGALLGRGRQLGAVVFASWAFIGVAAVSGRE